MSKENNNLRLLGSPVNLTYRSKKKEDKKNSKNRPRSALQNSTSPDIQERYKRPFSADTKDRAPSTRSFLKTFSAELLQSYDNSPLNVKVLPPTEELLSNSKAHLNETMKTHRDISSNASDFGSEDTFMSLGTKIKAKAQSGGKNRSNNTKNFIKYRNIAKKGRKAMDGASNEERNSGGNNYGLEVTITEKPRSPSPSRNREFQARSASPQFKSKHFESYFLSIDGDVGSSDTLAGRVSFAPVNSEIDRSLDTYAHRLGLNRQQLSLVEEESTQDLDSIPSQNMVSTSSKSTPDNEKLTAHDDIADTSNNKMKEKNCNYTNTTNTLMIDSQNYTNFYDDFHNNTLDTYKDKFSSTAIHTDTSSKDSGYPDSGLREEKVLSPKYSVPSTSFSKNTDFKLDTQDRTNSLEYPTTKDYCDYEREKKWHEPLNHSRLLYKEFFLKKESHVALPPQNSPAKCENPIPDTSELATDNTDKQNSNMEYPSYLLNSTTKAYTSKVIEDYKKELEAINNLHELTLKDIKIDAISPTPLHIGEMFEQNSCDFSDDKRESSENSQVDSNGSDVPTTSDKNSLHMNNQDITKVTTKELIQNYLKVKNDCTKDGVTKNFKKFDKKLNNMNSKCEENSSYKQYWNNRNSKNQSDKSNLPVNMRHQKNPPAARTPLSARIDSIQNDRDIESWMSMSAPSPRLLALDHDDTTAEEPAESNSKINEKPVEAEIKAPSSIASAPDSQTTKELDAKSTVLDIDSMLKEIESYGDNPVTSVTTANAPAAEPEVEEDEACNTTKDNFMEIFEFLEKVEQSANDALSVVTNKTPQTVPKLEALLKLPQTELAQRLVTATLQLEERSCCIALLQESLANHKEQMIQKVNNLEKQSHRNVAKVKQDCEETIKRHQNFIDQLINDKRSLGERVERLAEERRALEERGRRAARALQQRCQHELRAQRDKMAAAQQIARQRWVRQKAEKIKELTVKGLEGELREMAERQQKEISDLKMLHAEQNGRLAAKHAAELEEQRRALESEKEAALVKERQLASSRMEKQILELEATYQEQRSRLVGELRAERERAAAAGAQRAHAREAELEKWKDEQEKLLEEKKQKLEQEIEDEKKKIEERLKQKQDELEEEFERHKREYEAAQQALRKKKETETAARLRRERDAEIERAVERLEAEAQAGRRELHDALRRNKEQYEAELQELAQTERATLQRGRQAQARARAAEDRCAELEVTISQLETRNRVLTEKNSQLEARAEEVRASCEESWRGKVEHLEKTIEDMKKTHEEQMHQLYAKVKVAVARKDAALQALRRDAAALRQQLARLQQRLQLQRRDFLAAK